MNIKNVSSILFTPSFYTVAYLDLLHFIMQEMMPYSVAVAL